MCTTQNQHCVFEDNIISIINNVTLNECRLLCIGDSSCRYLSYYDKKGYPFPESCILFTQCKVYEYPNDNTCTSCITEDTTCHPAQSQHCVIEENIISIINQVTLDECRLLCNGDSACRYLSYYGKNGYPFTDSCILFTRVKSLPLERHLL